MSGWGAIAEALKKQKAEEDAAKGGSNEEVVAETPTKSMRSVRTVSNVEAKPKKASIWDRIRGKKIEDFREPEPEIKTPPKPKRSLWDNVQIGGENADEVASVKAKTVTMRESRPSSKASHWNNLDVSSIQPSRKSNYAFNDLIDDKDIEKLKSMRSNAATTAKEQTDQDFENEFEYNFKKMFNLNEKNGLQPGVNYRPVFNTTYNVGQPSQQPENRMFNFEPPLLNGMQLQTPHVKPITSFEVNEFRRKYPGINTVVFSVPPQVIYAH